jgi:putative hydrolase of the HAD superfamily
MDRLAAHTRFPRKHARLLRHLRTTHRLALVSNFDDGPVIHRILAREGIANLFDVTLISAEFGRRKPHPEIFHAALKHLELEPRAALFVGDSLIDDVGGACAAGIDVVWLEGAGLDAHTATADGPKPTYVIQSLDDLRAIA